MTHHLPSLRRPRRRLSLTRIASRFHRGVAKVEASLEPYARWWDEWNHDALRQDGPLWVALGDSVTQGIGATDPRRSYAVLTLERMRARTGERWRMINLSMSGGRFTDVVASQVKVIHDHGLEPQAVSAVIGSNDVIWRRDTSRIVADAEKLVDALPTGTVLSRVSGANLDRRRRGVNRVFDEAAAAGKVRLYEAWDWPTSRGMWAEDNFHPNDRAYHHLHENLYQAFERHGVIR